MFVRVHFVECVTDRDGAIAQMRAHQALRAHAVPRQHGRNDLVVFLQGLFCARRAGGEIPLPPAPLPRPSKGFSTRLAPPGPVPGHDAPARGPSLQ